MDVYEECKIFWNDFGNHDPKYYKVFVGVGLTADQYKEITGVDYAA